MKGSMFRAILKKYWKLLLSMVIVSALGCAIMIGLSGVYSSLEVSLNSYVRDYQYPDAVITTEVTKRDKIRDLLAVPGVEEVSARLVGDTVLQSPSGRYLSVRAMSYDEDDFQKFYFWSRAKEESGEDPILLECNFAVDNGIAAGDHVKVKIDADYREYFVAGIVSMPETLSVQPSANAWGANSDFGYIYAPRWLLARESNPDYDEGMETWEEKNRELEDAEKEAGEKHDEALTELEKAQKELDEKTSEYLEAKKELEEQRAQLQEKKAEALGMRSQLEEKQAEVLAKRDELLQKEKELKDQQELLNEKKAELTSKQAELDRQKSEAMAKQAELDKKRAEAESQQAALDSKRAEAESAAAELGAGKTELAGKVRELTEAEKTLTAEREKIEKAVSEAKEKQKALQETRQQLLDGQKELEKARREALAKQAELQKTQAELLEKRVEVEGKLATLRKAQEFLGKVDAAVTEADQTADVYEAAKAAVAEADRQLSDEEKLLQTLEAARIELAAIDAELSRAEKEGLDIADILVRRQEVLDELAKLGVSEEMLSGAIEETRTLITTFREQREKAIAALEALKDPKKLRESADALREQLSEMLSTYKITGSLSEAVLGTYVRQAEEGLTEIDAGVAAIKDGLAQITEGLALADEKEKEISDGLSLVESGEAVIEEGLKQADEALAKMDSGAEQIAAGWEEIEGYRAQIAEGEKKLRDGNAELEKYQAELDKGFATLDGFQKQLDEGYSTIDSYQSQINDGKTQIDSFQSQIDTGSTQIRDGFSQIDDGLSQIQDGFSQIDSGVAEIDEGTAKIDEAVAEGEKRLSEGTKELKKKQSEVENAWLDAIGEFSDVRDELEKALSELSEWEGYEVLCNQFMLRFSPEADREAVLAAAKEALGDTKINDSFTYEDSPVKDRVDINLAPVRTMSVFMPMIFFAVVLIVVFLFMSLLIRQCRREIGILRALGFTQGGIRALYCGIDLMVSVIASAIGLGVGFVLSRYVGKIFADFFPLPNYTYTIDLFRSILAVALTILVGQLATLIGTTAIGRIQPSEAMSRSTPGSARVPRVVEALTKKASPFVKFCVVSLVRNKGRFLFSVICLAASVMMIFSSFTFITSKNEILRQMFDQRIHYDCQVFLTKAPDEELLAEMNALPYVKDAQGTRYYTEDITFEGKTETAVSVNAIPEETELISVYGTTGKPVSVPREGMILEKHTAEKIGAKIGDTVLVGETPVKVTDISEQSVSRFQYISLHQADALKESPLGAVVCRIAEEDEQELLAYLTGRSDYLYCVFTHVLYASNAKTFATYDTAAWIIIGFAIIVGLVIVVNTAQTNLLEQKKELCILRILGFQHGELSRNWFVQSILHFLFACAVGLPTGGFLARAALRQLNTPGREYVYANGVKEYLFTAAIVFAYILVSHLISMHTLKKWDLVENVKDKE